MSLTLGQKLKQAREALGIPVSEVAAQTRIAPLYIESIDNDDYRALPGGIFNRGFVKSYAKYVGVDEQEALADYARLLNETEGNDVEEVKTFNPQVLTDENAPRSIVPTLIVALVILGLMTGGILFLVGQFNKPELPSADEIKAKTNAPSNDANSPVESETPVESASPEAPEMETLKVEFKALGESVSLSSTVDDTTSTTELAPGATKLFEPKRSLKLSYSRSKAQAVEMTINGKPIILPPSSANPNRPAVIEFEINTDNLNQIWTSGAAPFTPPVIVPPANSSTMAASNSTATLPINTKPKMTPSIPKPVASTNSAVLPKATNTMMKPINKAPR